MEKFNLSVNQAKALNPLVLAYVGDAVHTLYVRQSLVLISDAKAGQLHTTAGKVVSAVNQSLLSDFVLPLLDDTEKEIYRRARNAHSHSSAKNAELSDYKKASGYEAVLGFLYLTGQEERLKKILSINEITGENL